MSAKDALESGRCRLLSEEAQQILDALQDVPKSDTARCIHLLVDLAGVLSELERSMDNLSDNHQRTKWRDRAVCLRSELVLLLADRMQFPDPALFWDNIAMIVHISAGIRRELLQEQSKLLIPQKSQQNMEIQWRETHQAQARANGAAHPQTKPGHVQQVTANGSGGGFSEEVMALRTKLVMAQQDLQRRAADVRDTNQKMQAAVAERDKLQVMYNDLRCNLDPATQDQQAKAVRECGALREHARTLSMNLESHARVVENLISLNSELMDAANLRALESQMKADVEQGSGSAVPLLDK